MAEQNTHTSNEPPRPSQKPRPKWTTAWIFAVVLALLSFAGWWYWNSEQVRAAATETRSPVDAADMMTVEAISEGGASLVGRSISIANARVAQVSGTDRFWIAGSEGEPLLVVMERAHDTGDAQPALSIGERVRVEGVLLQGMRGDAALQADQPHVSKEPLHLAATTVQRLVR